MSEQLKPGDLVYEVRQTKSSLNADYVFLRWFLTDKQAEAYARFCYDNRQGQNYHFQIWLNAYDPKRHSFERRGFIGGAGDD